MTILNGRSRILGYLILSGITVLLIGFNQWLSWAVDPPPLVSVLLTLEKNEITAREPLKLELLIINNTDQTLDTITLNITASANLHWVPYDAATPSCAQEALESNHLIPSIGAQSSHAEKVCVKVGSNAEDGVYSVLFKLTYRTTQDGKLVQKVVPIQQDITINLVQIDSLVGVPLSLASFVLPGMVCLILLNVFGVFKNLGLTLESDEKFVLGTIISVVILGVGSLLNQVIESLFHWDLFPINAPVTLEALFLLMLLGSVLAVIGTGLYWKYDKRQASLCINLSDNYSIILQKILRMNPNYEDSAVSVKLKDKLEEYYGSHLAEFRGQLFLVGSLGINFEDVKADNPTKEKEIDQIRRTFEQSGKKAQDIQALHQNLERLGFQDYLQVNNFIKRKKDDQLDDLDKVCLSWPIDSIAFKQRDGGLNFPYPLVADI